jgi:hypothetical protein
VSVIEEGQNGPFFGRQNICQILQVLPWQLNKVMSDHRNPSKPALEAVEKALLSFEDKWSNYLKADLE